MKYSLLLLAFLMSFATKSRCEGVTSALATRALQVKINPEGFRTISSGVAHSVLREVSREPLPDMDENVGYGIQAKLTEMVYSLKFKDFQLTAGAGNLFAVIDVDEIRVEIPKARFTKNVGTTIKTTCKNTVLTAGHASSVKLHLTIVPRVVNGALVLDAAAVTFPLSEGEFNVSGPESCSGDLGVGQVFKLALNKALKMARGRIATTIENQARDAVPEITRQMNGAISQEVPLAVGQGTGAPIKNLILAASPDQVAVTPDEALFSLNVSVREGLKDRILRSATQFSGQENYDVSLGSFGIRTAFINEMIASAMPALPNTLEVDTKSSQVLREIFSRQGLGSILPDIIDVRMDQEIVMARIGFGHAPTINSVKDVNGGAVLSLSIPDLRIFIDIIQDGVRVPYFEMTFATAVNIRLDIVAGQMTLNLEQPSTVTVDGRWAPGYRAGNPLFESDVAKTIFFTAMDILCQGGSLPELMSLRCI